MYEVTTSANTLLSKAHALAAAGSFITAAAGLEISLFNHEVADPMIYGGGGVALALLAYRGSKKLLGQTASEQEGFDPTDPAKAGMPKDVQIIPLHPADAFHELNIDHEAA